MRHLSERYQREIEAHHRMKDARASLAHAAGHDGDLDEALEEINAAGEDLKAARALPEGFVCIPCGVHAPVGAQAVLVLKAVVVDYTDGREPVRWHFDPNGPEVYFSICIACTDGMDLLSYFKSIVAPRIDPAKFPAAQPTAAATEREDV